MAAATIHRTLDVSARADHRDHHTGDHRAAATEPAATAAPLIGQCATSDAHGHLGNTDGAMGSWYTPLVFTNTGSTTCTLDGHPGVSFVDATGTQIGPSAERTDATTPTVAFAPGEQANA